MKALLTILFCLCISNLFAQGPCGFGINQTLSFIVNSHGGETVTEYSDTAVTFTNTIGKMRYTFDASGLCDGCMYMPASADQGAKSFTQLSAAYKYDSIEGLWKNDCAVVMVETTADLLGRYLFIAGRKE